ncbi:MULTISPECIES: DUF1398 family protein [unclassified Pseudocitrobacter]|uniref:DUF1398 family protein n=1 Tax=unclassified Pseudocitrobacter TaxID=2638778 RepID=UPI0011EE6EA5|nr:MULTISPECIES: DUF1398 family protein [unclassified Pseudocitrobacter]KAA1049139.1 DUF1398 domain-containing protein [Pseudocitrobacter sp. 73]MDF3830835.1 DUF1398 family protein [Pseudocitrobacter sp. 2023EL-00150]MEC5376459.1 DUF1398 domain-containing protein [Pseudocitrobacter sp. MW920760]
MLTLISIIVTIAIIIIEAQIILRTLFSEARTQITLHELIKELEKQNIVFYVHFVSTGNVNLVDNDGCIRIIEGEYSLKRVNLRANEDLIRAASRRHFAGEIGYEEYCSLVASAGVYKWIVDIKQMTRKYVGLSDKVIFCEEITPVISNERVWRYN